MTAKEITISNTANKNMAELISLACSFNSRIILENGHFSINAKSLMESCLLHPWKEPS